MLHTTQAIVLNSFAYNETSLIAKLYTQSFGLKSYIIKGIRKSKKPFSSSLFQPLQIIEAEIYNNPRQSLQVLKNASLAAHLFDLQTNIVKSTLRIFISEVINLSIRGEEEEKAVFEFLSKKIMALNAADNTHLAEYHLHFMIEFASLLGFNLTNYEWDTSLGISNIALPQQSDLHLPKSERNLWLAALILFYENHITSGRKIISHKVLHEILN